MRDGSDDSFYFGPTPKKTVNPRRRDSLPRCEDVTERIRCVLTETLDVQTAVLGANKKVIKHLFGRGNKNTLFGVGAPAAEALSGSHLENPPF